MSTTIPRLVRRMSTAKLEMLVLGSGPSTSVPSVRCLVTNNDCHVCAEARENIHSRNRRGNPSLFIKHQGLNILIDCGKTFRDSLLRNFPQHPIYPIDAVVLTHGHADACFGLDDLRDVQRKKSATELESLPIHCSHRTRFEIESKFDYLFEQNEESIRWTAKLQWKEFTDMELFTIRDKVAMRALPVWHGRDYVANGFEFGSEIGRRVVYISDVTQLTDQAVAHLCSGPSIDILFIDALHTSQKHGTHMSLPEALETIQLVKPRKSYLIGMGHSFDYAVHQPELQQLKSTLGIDVEMTYDGLSIELNPSQ